MADEIVPGQDPSYQLCKVIYVYHPLGAKIAEAPISMAQSQQREVVLPGVPDEVLKAFLDEREALGLDRVIYNHYSLARVYGAATLVLMVDGLAPGSPVDWESLYQKKVGFNVADPLNTGGSLVLNQNPNDMDFLKPGEITVAGIAYHPSRMLIRFNESPVYLEYTTSGFGFVGRSVYQRILFPLKSYVQTMRTDDMVTRKAGLLIEKVKPAGSIGDRLSLGFMKIKRTILKQAQTDNVISIDPEESIETLNMQNIDGAVNTARANIIKNIATGADMPARWLDNETMVDGFSEGTEDSKKEARYVERCREDAKPIYDFTDKVAMYRAWNPDFYAAIQAKYTQYKNVSFKAAFQAWRNAFAYKWPSLLIEPDSERAKSEDVKLKAVVALLEVIMPMIDPANSAVALQWAADNFNELQLLFAHKLEFDFDELESFLDKKAKQMESMAGSGDGAPGERGAETRVAPAFSARDAVRRDGEEEARGGAHVLRALGNAIEAAHTVVRHRLPHGGDGDVRVLEREHADPEEDEFAGPGVISPGDFAA